MKLSLIFYVLLLGGFTSTVFLFAPPQFSGNQQPKNPQRLATPYSALDDSCNCGYVYRKIFAQSLNAEQASVEMEACKAYQAKHCVPGRGGFVPQTEENSKDNEEDEVLSNIPDGNTCPARYLYLNKFPENSTSWTVERIYPDRNCKPVEEKIVFSFQPPYMENPKTKMRKIEVLFFMFEKGQTVDNIFSLPSNKHNEWMNHSNHASAEEFYRTMNIVLLIPERNGNRVWMVKNGDTSPAELKGWSADWIDDKRGMLETLAAISYATPDVGIIKLGKYGALVTGSVKNKKFKVCINNNGGMYTPFDELPNTAPSKKAYILDRILTSRQNSHLNKLYAKWMTEERERFVSAMLPAYIRSEDPREVLGKPASSNETPPNISRALEGLKPIDFLVGDSIWQADGTRISTWPSKNEDPWFEWLRIADPNIQFIGNPLNDKAFLFIFRKSPNTLWVWKPSDNYGKAPRIERFLKGEEIAALNNFLIRTLIEEIKGSGISISENQFFYQRAMEPGSFNILDWRPSPGNASGRVILYETNHSSSIPALFCLGDNYDQNHAITFRMVDRPWQGWQGIRQSYQKYLADFDDQLLGIRKTNLEAWYGPNRFGTSFSKEDGAQYVSVFPSPGSTRFSKDVRFDLIMQKVNEAPAFIYLGKSALHNRTMFEAWLTEDWRKSGNWMANPLGFIDRANF